jgi:hypothetical protein
MRMLLEAIVMLVFFSALWCVVLAIDEQLEDLEQAILSEPARCDGPCPYVGQCRAMSLACQRFQTYVVGDRTWQAVEKTLPTRQLYEEIFGIERRPRRPDRVQRLRKKRPARPRSRASAAINTTTASTHVRQPNLRSCTA